MSQPLYYEELAEGAHWRSMGRTITQADVANFACLTGDYDPLHMDHEFAKDSIYQGPVAHGLFGLTLVAGLGQQAPWAATVSFASLHEWHFRLPLYVGDTVHVVTEVLRKEFCGRRQGRVLWQRQLVNQRGEVVQEGIFETLVSLERTGTHDAYRSVPQVDVPIIQEFRLKAA